MTISTIPGKRAERGIWVADRFDCGCTWVSTERWFDWKTQWHEQGIRLRPYLEAGKQVQALSYLGHTPYGVKEDAYFCYATARLAGFVWNGGVPLSHPDVAPLYRLRLGKPSQVMRRST
jgi:hypothetical protein